MATTVYSGSVPGGALEARVAALAADRERDEREKSTALARALEEEKLKKATLARQQEELVMDTLRGVMQGGQGQGPGQTQIDPSKPMEFSNINANNSYQQGGKGQMKNMQDLPNMFDANNQLKPDATFQGQPAMQNPLVKKILFGNAFGEFPEEKAARDMAIQDRYMERMAMMEREKTERSEAANLAAEKRQESREQEAMRRARSASFAQSVAQIRSNLDKRRLALAKDKLLWGGDSARMKQIKDEERAAIADYRIDLKNEKEAYRIMAVADNLPLPQYDDEALHQVEIEGLEDRLRMINPDWLAIKQDFNMPAILKAAKSLKKTPEEIIAAIEQLYMQEGGKLKEWKRR